MVAGDGVQLRGRSSECAELDRVLDHARTGHSAVLVLRGEAGIGKSTLLRYAADRAAGFRVAQVVGVESEIELAYAGLHQLCTPLLDHAGSLPRSQQASLDAALGLAAGDPPDRFLVALATLGLLSAVAEREPLLCIVDDMQWLDDASAGVLGFVARRLLAEPIAMLIAVRDPSDDTRLAGLTSLTVSGLDDDDARALLRAEVPGRIDERVLDRIVAEAHGNPLAVIALPRCMSAAELAGGFAVGAAAVPESIQASLRRRLDVLPPDTRRLLQLAAADPVGEPLVVWRAAELLGIRPDAAAAAVEAGLFEVGAQMRFSHPLVRSTAYRSASPAERMAFHAALADATDADEQPDRRAWHRAQAVAGPDALVADALEHSAARAEARGGVAASAAFLETAATLTPDPVVRARRLLAAARAKRDAGALDASLRLLAAVGAGPASALDLAEVEHLRGQIALDQRRAGDAAQLLTDAARRLGPLDPARARATHLEALGAAIWAGDLQGRRALRDIARAAQSAPRATGPPAATDVVLEALALRVTNGFAAAAPALQQALEAAVALEVAGGDLGQWLWLSGARAAGFVAFELWDADAWHTLAVRQVRAARDAGALVQLQFALNFLARSHGARGDLAVAAMLVDEERTIAQSTGRPAVGYEEMILAAWRGDEQRASSLIRSMVAEATTRGLGRMLDVTAFATALLGNAAGRYEEACEAARPAFERDLLGFSLFVVPELAEAASRTGDRGLVVAARDWLAKRSKSVRTGWLLGIEARVRALLGEADAAERDYQESITQLSGTRLAGELARSRLLFGEWLRREGRRVDARQQLRTAFEAFNAMGMDGFAERAQHELLATGETVRKRRDDTRSQLTPQEEHIARLAVAGHTNAEIGSELFISPRTVEWHLKKVFTKLGVSSRRELRNAMPHHAGPTSAFADVGHALG